MSKKLLACVLMLFFVRYAVAQEQAATSAADLPSYYTAVKHEEPKQLTFDVAVYGGT